MVTTTLSLPLVATLVFTFICWLQNKIKLSKKYKNNSSLTQLPPGPTPWPILGCLPQMLTIRNMSTFRWVNKIMAEMNTEIACIRVGIVHVIPVTSPELVCEFLIKKDSVFSARPRCMCSGLASDGYLTTHATITVGDHWKKMKKLLTTHVLSPKAHQWLFDRRMEEADHLMRNVYNQCILCSGVINVRHVARHFCANMMKEMVFNKRSLGNGSTHEDEEHLDACFVILDHVFGFSISNYMPYSWLSKLDLDGHQEIQRRAVRRVKKYQDPLIDERINMWKDGIKNTQEDILDVFINLKDSDGKPLLTAKEIKAEIIELMITIVDNPSNAVEWALAEMLNQPKTLEKAKAEIDSTVGKDKLVQECHLPKLNYVKACLKEAFRIHPVAPFNLPHVALSDTIVGNNYFIPKGSHVIISRAGLGRNPRIWEDPLMFKPERHLRVNNNSINKECEVVFQDPALRMFTFGAGRRGCPGVLLGSDVTTMLFARLLQGFDWSLPPDVQRIELTEAKNNMYLAKPLTALAKPRLPDNIYPY